MISEATIETVLDRLETGGDALLESDLQSFAERQPELMDYLTNEDVEAFTESERDLLVFAALVIFRAVEMEQPDTEPVTGDQLAAAEEKNYAQLSSVKASDFRERLTPFFENTPQEDLLAFVEDITVAEGDDEISSEAREPFFVTLKTVIDTLT